MINWSAFVPAAIVLSLIPGPNQLLSVRNTIRYGTGPATRQEFAVAATNPKAMLLFAAFLPQFLPSGTATGGSLLILATAYIGIEAVAAVCYTALGGLLSRVELTARSHRHLDRVTGTAFFGLGGYLATEQRA